MKRIIFFLCFLLILTGCATNPENRINEDRIKCEATELNVTYSAGIYHDKNWDEETGTYTKNAVPDKETAVAIASAIFDAMEKSSVAETFTVQDVFYDELDRIWIISFWESTSDDTQNFSVTYVGYSCSIAIKEADGTVLRIWFGE